jgi:hypothetical protein
MPILAGVPVRDELVEALAESAYEPAASTLRGALEADRAVVALTVLEREQLLRALEDCPDGLGQLRAVLLREHEWRVREALVSRRSASPRASGRVVPPRMSIPVPRAPSSSCAEAGELG